MPAKKIIQKTPHKSSKKLNNEIRTHQIDASGKILGRLSTEVSILLRGKNKPQFRPYMLVGDKVIVFNVSKIKVSGHKMTQKKYYRHSGYIGNLKTETMQDVFRKNPSEILKRAVRGMLPKNKLQDKWMKNLIIYNQDITKVEK